MCARPTPLAGGNPLSADQPRWPPLQPPTTTDCPGSRHFPGPSLPTRATGSLSRGAAWARWPSGSSKPVRCGNPTLGRFDSGAAPLSRLRRVHADLGLLEAGGGRVESSAQDRRRAVKTIARLSRARPIDSERPARHVRLALREPLRLLDPHQLTLVFDILAWAEVHAQMGMVCAGNPEVAVRKLAWLAVLRSGPSCAGTPR